MAKLYYVHNDHLGTPQVVTNQAQQVVYMADYQPFGKLQPGQVNSIELYSRFPGQSLDAETGLYYNYFRDYDPSIGRYIESDPIGLDGGINTYAYVEGNPMSFSDPEGLRGMANYARPLFPETWNSTTASRMENFNNSQYRKYYKDGMRNNGYPDNMVPPYPKPDAYCYIECEGDDSNTCPAPLPPPSSGFSVSYKDMLTGKTCRQVCLGGPIAKPAQ